MHTTLKIQLGLEVPTAHLDSMVGLVDWFFCIATECHKDQAYYDWHVHRPNAAKVMLDNGMYEEGKPMDIRDLLHLAECIQPEVVFAPDQVGDAKLTLDMTQEFIARVKASKALPNTKVGVIPQGKDPEEIVSCYRAMMRKGLIQGNPVGISFLNDRDAVASLMPWDPKIWYHYLGLYNTTEIASWPEAITSMDTVKPIKGAYHNYRVEDTPRGLGKWNTRMEVQNTSLMYRNISKMHHTLTRSLL